MIRSSVVVSLALVALLGAGCTAPNPNYRPDAPRSPDDASSPGDASVHDAADAPPAVDGQPTDALPDGATCAADAFLRCDGDDAIFCNSAGTGEQAQACEHGCNTTAERCNECEPSTATCTGDTLSACSADGLSATESCALGCNSVGDACTDVDPSNGLAVYLDMAADGPALVLPSGATVNTTTGVISAGGDEIAVDSYLVPAAQGGIDIRVYPVSSLAMSTISVTGNPAVAFVSDGDIQIAGTVTVKAGKFTGDPDCEGTKGTCETVVVGENTAVICGGGSGAGFGGHGGDPGVSENGTSNFSGGNVSGDADLEPLRGGCESPGFSMFGSAIRAPGGAIQLVSRTKIEILPGGFLDLNGTGGQVHSLGGFAGSGGASGGAALLEAPLVTVAASAGIAANGGGGAGGCANGGDGGLSASRAQGADCSEGDGGDGGAGGTKDGTTGSNATDPLSAGNGGGGAGRIRINTPIGKFLPEGGAIVSPTPSTGTLGTR